MPNIVFWPIPTSPSIGNCATYVLGDYKTLTGSLHYKATCLQHTKHTVKCMQSACTYNIREHFLIDLTALQWAWKHDIHSVMQQKHTTACLLQLKKANLLFLYTDIACI